MSPTEDDLPHSVPTRRPEVAFNTTPDVGTAGTRPSESTVGNNATENVSSARFLRRNTMGATTIGIPRTSRNNSVSSVDTADLMDHRSSTFMGWRDSNRTRDSFANLERPNPSSFISRRRRSSTTAGPSDPNFATPFKQSRTSPTKSLRSKSFSSPSFIERMVQGRDSSSKTPLLRDKLDYMPNYESLDAVDRSSEALAVDIDSLNLPSRNVQQRGRLHSGFSSSVNARQGFTPDRNQRPFNGDEYSDILGSEIASRRSSSVSSLDDVCLPIDSPGASSTLGAGCTFDLSYLEEFAANERKELLDIQQSVPAESIFGIDSGQGTTSSMAGVNALTSQKVNEVDFEGGRLRPHRVVPWENTGGIKRLNQLRTSRSNQGKLPDLPERRTTQTGLNLQYAPTPIYDSEDTSSSMRFTYFREDMDATVHSPTISGLLQPGQNFDDLFNVTVYGQQGYHNPQYVAGKEPGAQASVPELNEIRTESMNVLGPAVAFSNSSPKNHELPIDSTSGHRRTHSKVNLSTPGAPSGHTTPGLSTTPSRSRESSLPIPPDVDLPASSTSQTQPVLTNPLLEPSPFWLDVLNPTEEEMKVLSKSFGIHPLTTEDIFLGETREKVELFRNYYLVCFRSFDIHDERNKRRSQTARHEDAGLSVRGDFSKSDRPRRKKKHNSELTPLNMYIIVFHDGVITVSVLLD